LRANETDEGASLNAKAIIILAVSHVLVDLTGTALPALLPFLKSALALNYTQVGAVIMVANLTSSIIQPCFGYLSDRAELKWLLPAATALVYLGFSVVGLATSYPVLLLFVVFSGIGVAFYHPEAFKMMHYLSGLGKATGMGFFQVGGNLGLAFGPLFMTYAVQIAGLHGTLLFLIIGLPMVGVLAISLKQLALGVQNGKGKEQGHGTGPQSKQRKGAWASMSLLIAAVTLRSTAHMGLITFVPFYYISALGGTALTAGKLVFAFLLGGALGTMVGAIIADRIGHKRYFCLSLACSVPLLFCFLYAGGVWVFVLLFVIGAVLISSFSVTVVMGQTILRDRLGMASGLMLGFVIGVGGVGAGLLGIMADAWGILWVIRLIVLMPAVALLPALIMRYPAKVAART
jgi:MFS transporter, FSR family, fosmidomycin resistance protein